VKCIFLGNPAPVKFVAETVNTNFSVADNIAQNNVIEGLYQHYHDDFAVITTAANFGNPHVLNKATRKQSVKLDCGADAIAVGNLNYNKLIYYLSIIVTYTMTLFKVLKRMKASSTDNTFVIITSGPYIFVSLPIFFVRLVYKICYIPFLIGSVELPDYGGLFKVISKLSVIMVKMADGSITYVERSSEDYTHKPYVSILYSLNRESIALSNSMIDNCVHNEKFTVAYTGALTRIKGMDKLVQVVRATGNTYKWVICGNGEYGNEIQKLSQNTDYDVEFLGIVTNEKSLEVQHNADLLLALQSLDTPAYRYYSTYAASGKLVEYLLSGTPILTPDIGAISRKIKPYLNFLDNQDTETIVNKLNEMSNTKSLSELRDKADAGRTYVIENANNDVQNRNILEFIEKCHAEKK